jgi:predicted membrane protein
VWNNQTKKKKKRLSVSIFYIGSVVKYDMQYMFFKSPILIINVLLAFAYINVVLWTEPTCLWELAAATKIWGSKLLLGSWNTTTTGVRGAGLFVRVIVFSCAVYLFESYTNRTKLPIAFVFACTFVLILLNTPPILSIVISCFAIIFHLFYYCKETKKKKTSLIRLILRHILTILHTFLLLGYNQTGRH